MVWPWMAASWKNSLSTPAAAEPSCGSQRPHEVETTLARFWVTMAW